MNDAQESRAFRILKMLQRKLSWLLCVFRSLTSASGWWSPGPVYAELLSRVRDGNTYTLTFLSKPGRRYSIQQTYDLAHWMEVAQVDSTEDSSNVTEWESPAVAAGAEVYYRIQLLPEREFHCYTQSADGADAIPAKCLYTDDLATLG